MLIVVGGHRKSIARMRSVTFLFHKYKNKTVKGALMHVERALRKAQTVECKICGRTGSL
jgi:rRNA processing protein Krr1/Pno1